MSSFAGTWKRDSDELTLRQLGTRVVGWLTLDGTAIEVNGTLHEETLTLLVEGEEGAAKLSKGVLVVRGKSAAKGRWTLEPLSIAVEGPGLHSLDEPSKEPKPPKKPPPKPPKKDPVVSFAGAWQASGSVGQDTASWYAQLRLVEGKRGVLTGTLVRWIEGWNPAGGPPVREQLRFTDVSGKRSGDKASITIDGEAHELERVGDRLELVSPLGRREQYQSIATEAVLRSPSELVGFWKRGGSLPFETGTWEQQIELRVADSSITGRFRASRETWSQLGNLEREDSQARITGTIGDDTCTACIDGAVVTLRLVGDSLFVDGAGEATGTYERG